MYGFKIEVWTKNGGFFGRYSSFDRAKKVADWLKSKGITPKLISKYYKSK